MDAPYSRDLLEAAKNKYGLFAKYSFRDGQLMALDAAMTTDKDICIIEAPTGLGKSLLGMTYGEAHDTTFGYLCSSKALQSQISNDLPEVEMLWGRSNYPCAMTAGRTQANMCLSTKDAPCEVMHQCEYINQRTRVEMSKRQVLNYAYMLTAANFANRFNKYSYLISDEADTLEDVLTRFVELRISANQLRKLGIDEPGRKTSTCQSGLDAWRLWANDASNRVSRELKKLGDPQDPMLMKIKADYETVATKLDIFLCHMDENWIFDLVEYRGQLDAYVFKPVWLTPALANEYFWRHSSKHLLMSATWPDKRVTAHSLGLDINNIEFVSVPSSFPSTNRPVYLTYSAPMDSKSYTQSISKILCDVERVAAKYGQSKGVIHTVSWQLNQEIMKLNNPRFITHTGQDKDKQLDHFRRSDKPLIWVSPSSSRGLDLPDDLCRFQILPKAPYLYLGDKVVSRRLYGSGAIGKLWYESMAAQEVEQMCGRGVRHQDDYCETWILDSCLCDMVIRRSHLFHDYWLDAVNMKSI